MIIRTEQYRINFIRKNYLESVGMYIDDIQSGTFYDYWDSSWYKQLFPGGISKNEQQ